MQRDEVVGNRLRERHREVFRRNTEKYGGEILQYFGDGTLSIYPSASAAVECALDIQRELKSDPTVPLRIGIHTGDISFSEEEVFGDGVNIASRIESECVPGGIFISGKVYDDIRNHSRIKALSLGHRQLKNIRHPVELYAISNPGITVPEDRPESLPATTYASSSAALPGSASADLPDGWKTKGRAGTLALLLGAFGAHRFYLGQRKMGTTYLAITLAGIFGPSVFENLVPVMFIIATIEAFVFWFMTKADFDKTYNAKAAKEQAKEAAKVKPRQVAEVVPQSARLQQFEQLKNRAIEEFNRFDYQRALDSLRKAAELKNDDPQIHFLMACCFSVFEETEKALLQLDTAVAFGWDDLPRIRQQYELAFLRDQPVFKTFEKNNYRLPEELPLPDNDALHLDQTMAPDLLEQLNKLQELRKEGILDEGEYLRLKVAIQASGKSER